ncbi:MAG: VCBS repeat-containing protein [Polyangiaceae bacterium]
MRCFRLSIGLTVSLSVALTAATSQAQTVVNLVTDALDPQACSGQGCWTNHMRLADMDSDGDLDLLLVNYPDFFGGSSSTEPLVLYANDGNGNFTNVSASALGNYAGAHHQVALGDVDHDGDLDIFGPQGDGSPAVLLINDGGTFMDEAPSRLVASPQGGAARMGDVDGDGDLDIFSSDGYSTNGPPFGHLYLNDGTGHFTEAANALPTTINGNDIDDVEFADVDRDFDLDLVINAHSGGTGALWLNDGSGKFAAGGTLAPPGPGSNYHYNVAPCDVDNDGDLDLWIDNIGGNYTEQLQINDGSGHFTDETSARVSGNIGADDNGVVCVDIDADGDLDAVVISLGSPERYLQNDGTGHFTFISGAFPGPTNCSLWGEFGDLNGDDRLDLVTSQGECSSSDEVYFGNSSMPVDSVPPRIIAVSTVPDANLGGTAPVLFAVSDRTVTDDGPELARVYAVIDPSGAATPVEGWAVGGDLSRVELPTSTVGPQTFRVCAVDRSKNETCSADETYNVIDTTGSGGAGGAGGAAPTGGASAGGASAGGASAGGASAGGAAAGGAPAGGAAAGGGGSDDGGDDGCSCVVAASDLSRAPAWSLMLGLSAVALARRRRR